MKKLIKFFAAGLLLASLAACGSDPADPSDPSDPTPVDPTPTVEAVTIAPDDIQVLDSTQSSSYEKYRGAQEVKGLNLNLQDVLVQNQYSPAVKVIQFKAQIGTLTIANTKGFKSVTIKIVDSYDFNGGVSVNDQNADIATVNAGKAATEYKSGNYDVSEFTYTITLASAPENLVLKAVNQKSDGSGYTAVRVTSITLA